MSRARFQEIAGTYNVQNKYYNSANRPSYTRQCVRMLRNLWGEAPKKCSTFSERSQHVLWDLWSTLIVTPDFSSDLERGAVPRSIADEKSGVTVLVIELHWSQDSE